jgi:NADH-quinone oxidoreductase subunit H
MKVLFYYLIFPGFLFTAVAGMLASWVDRKVTARVQWRQGPPWYQNFADFIKLLGKEIIVPKTGKWIFLISPFLGLASVSIVATLLGRALMNPSESFLGDLIVVMYLLTIPAIAVILGASASSNPLACVGASREIKLVLSDELPFILAIVIAIIKSGSLLRINEIINYQMASGSIVNSLSGTIAFIILILCIQAKLGFVPFDMSEAEQEIMAGVSIEYSGLPLAILKLTRQMLLVVLPIFLISMFWAYSPNVFWIIFKYVILLVIIILIKNTNPRLKIDQAARFFWGPMAIAASVGVILALIGY